MRGGPGRNEGFSRCRSPLATTSVAAVRNPSNALELTVRHLAAALAVSHHLPPVPGTEVLPHSALTTGERAVREAYVRRERARRLARRRALLARSIHAVVPAQRSVTPR